MALKNMRTECFHTASAKSIGASKSVALRSV